MRTHGWAGVLPADEAEARLAITAAAGELLDAGDVRFTMQAVAAAAGISRPTLYRYFANGETLLQATAKRTSDELVDEAVDCARGISDPGGAIAEVLSFIYSRFRTRRRFAVLFAQTDAHVFAAITSPSARRITADALRRLDVDWADRGWDDQSLVELAEHLLRILQSHVLDPGSPPRTEAQFRSYLRRWITPIVGASAHPQSTAAVGV